MHRVWGNVLHSNDILISVRLLMLSLHHGLRGTKFKHKQDKPIFKMGTKVLECDADAVMRLPGDLSSFSDCFYKQPG